MSNLYPEIRDTSTLTGVFNLDQFLTVGIEGQADSAGSAAIATPQLCKSADDVNAFFGPNSSLSVLCRFVLAQGLNYVWAVASAKGAPPILSQRQTAWATLEENPDIRIRLTDSEVQGDLVALADSCEWAEGIQHKQFMFGGLASPTTQAALLAAAAAIASKRGVLVGPGYIDGNGVLLSGRYAAARIACEVARNPDITDDLDTLPLAATNGVEKDPVTGMPLFRLRAGGGIPVNDFAALLTGGVSPLRQGRTGQAEIVHLRMTYSADATFDALMTLLIKDEIFLGLKAELEVQHFLRRGNTPTNRSLCAKIVDEWLKAHSDWLQPVILPNGAVGYGVTVTSSSDKKKIIVSYQGEIVRNNQVIELQGSFTIPV